MFRSIVSALAAPRRRGAQALGWMCWLASASALAQATAPAAAPGVVPAAVVQGQIKGRAWQHTAASRDAMLAQAQVGLPASVTGGAPYVGQLAAAPRDARVKVPVVLFLHGSSGLGLAAIAEWQAWLARLGVASLAPDSMVLPDRITYSSPIDKPTYEKIHALRGAEITIALDGLRSQPWADPSRLVLAGTSEGAVAVARNQQPWAGRMIFSWSCEDNYFVEMHATHVGAEPVLNVVSATDVYFSPSNPWLGNPAAHGHCGAAFKQHKATMVVLVPGAPHTLLNLPPVRQVTQAWLSDLLKLTARE